jgi:hypothetical protein
MSCSLMKHRSSGWKTFLAHLEVSLNEREGFFGSSPEAGSPRELAPVREAGGSLGDLVEDWRLEGWVFVFSVHRRADRGGSWCRFKGGTGGRGCGPRGTRLAGRMSFFFYAIFTCSDRFSSGFQYHCPVP